MSQVSDRAVVLCNSRNEELPQDMQDVIFSHADSNRDGRMDYKEFVRLVCICIHVYSMFASDHKMHGTETERKKHKIHLERRLKQT